MPATGRVLRRPPLERRLPHRARPVRGRSATTSTTDLGCSWIRSSPHPSPGRAAARSRTASGGADYMLVYGREPRWAGSSIRRPRPGDAPPRRGRHGRRSSAEEHRNSSGSSSGPRASGSGQQCRRQRDHPDRRPDELDFRGRDTPRSGRWSTTRRSTAVKNHGRASAAIAGRPPEEVSSRPRRSRLPPPPPHLERVWARSGSHSPGPRASVDLPIWVHEVAPTNGEVADTAVDPSHEGGGQPSPLDLPTMPDWRPRDVRQAAGRDAVLHRRRQRWFLQMTLPPA